MPVKGGAFTCTGPAGVVGQSYVSLNRGKRGVSVGSVLAGPTFIEISA